MARGITSFRLQVSNLLGDIDRQLIGQLVIERIQDRATSGRNIDGGRFARYAPAYVDYLRKIGADDGLDLTLTGEMLNSIEILSHGPGFVEIGLERGSFAARKATWNQGGNPDIPSRPFMGIKDSEANRIEADVAAVSPVVAAQRFLNEQNVIGRIFENISLDVLNG